MRSIKIFKLIPQNECLLKLCVKVEEISQSGVTRLWQINFFSESEDFGFLSERMQGVHCFKVESGGGDFGVPVPEAADDFGDSL